MNKELMAPLSRLCDLEEIYDSGADAVYCGGKKFNMRMCISNCQLSDEELAEAARIAKRKNKKIYVTVNNLLWDNEIEEAGAFLEYCQNIGIDGVIMQDFGLMDIAAERGLTIPLQASVQMGINSSSAIDILSQNGLSRFVIARGANKDEIREIKRLTDAELEYFVHGDASVGYDGKCRFSGMLGQRSGNRGLCKKPCRWQYKLNGKGDYKHYLAHKDLCMYPCLDEMLDVGIYCYKIEGRLRQGDYISDLVSRYAAGFRKAEAGESLKDSGFSLFEDIKVRDFTTGGWNGRITLKDMGTDGTKEPMFISTQFKEEQIGTNGNRTPVPALDYRPSFVVKPNDLQSVKEIVKHEIKKIVLPLVTYRQPSFSWNEENLAAATAIAKEHGVEVYLETPYVVQEGEKHKRFEWVELKKKIGADGFVVNDLGTWQDLLKAGETNLVGGEGFNVANHRSVAWVGNHGGSCCMLSPEMPVTDIPSRGNIPRAMLIQGGLRLMVLELCLFSGLPCDERCPKPCAKQENYLEDVIGQKFPVFTDTSCRNYVYDYSRRCGIACLQLIGEKGVENLVIDGTFYGANQLGAVVDLYHEAIEKLNAGEFIPADFEDKMVALNLGPHRPLETVPDTDYTIEVPPTALKK